MTEDEIQTIVSRVVAELQEPEVTPTATNWGHFNVAAGATILADHMNSALDQAIPKFASATARDAQWPTPPVGAFCYLTDWNYFMVYDSAITGGSNVWRLASGMRVGVATMGLGQVIPNNASTQVKLGSTTVGIPNAANRPGRGTWAADGSYTSPTAAQIGTGGIYQVTAKLIWPANATGQRTLSLRRYTAGAWSSTGIAGGHAETNVAGATPLRQSITGSVYLAAGEKVALYCYQQSGGNLTLATTGEVANMSIQMIGSD